MRVLDLSQLIAGPYCSKLLADYGATVTKVERPNTGDPGRQLPPLKNTARGPQSALFEFLNGNKRGVTLDLERPADRDHALRLVKNSDVVVQDFYPPSADGRGLDYESCQRINPQVVHLSVSEYGEDGPIAESQASSELLAWALSGALYSGGIPGREPLKLQGSFGHLATGVLGALLASSMYYRLRTRGVGGRADVSIVDTLAVLIGHWDVSVAAATGVRARTPYGARMKLAECKDGFVGLNFFSGSPRLWDLFCAMTGRIDLLDDPRFAAHRVRVDHWDEFLESLSPWLMSKTVAEIFEESVTWNLPFALVADIPQVLDLEQHSARGFYVTGLSADLPNVRVPGPPVRLADGDWSIRTPAPDLGQHTEEVLAEAAADASAGGGRRPSAPAISEVSRLPLDGVRVLDLTYHVAGPTGTRLLADLGADVVKVESLERADPSRLAGAPYAATGAPRYESSAQWNWRHLNKRAITLDLQSDIGRDLFKRLTVSADTIVENLRPGVWEGFGLDYEELRQVNPRLSMLRMPGYGCTGPWRNRLAWAFPMEQLSGFTSTFGYQDERPITRGLWPDCAGGMMAAFGTVLSLHKALTTGSGQFADVSQLEAATSLNVEAILDYQINGRDWGRQGNRHPFGRSAPHGCSPCKGEDEWIAIAVTDDDQWSKLCAVLGADELQMDPRFRTIADRHDHHRELAGALAEYTRRWTRWDLAAALQGADVPAMPVVEGVDVLDGSRLEGVLPTCELDRQYIGRKRYLATLFRLDGRRPAYRRPAPTLGQDNADILREIGLADRDIAELVTQGIIGTEPRNL